MTDSTDKKKTPKRTFDSPLILETIGKTGKTGMNISDLSREMGIEITPSLKRRLSWMTLRDKTLRTTTRGRGKNKTTIYIRTSRNI